jgi:hypothetical protein
MVEHCRTPQRPLVHQNMKNASGISPTKSSLPFAANILGLCDAELQQCTLHQSGLRLCLT